MIEILCDNKNAFFLPNLLDILVMTGMTMKVVPKAPKHPNNETHMPLASASPLNSLNTITKNVSDATVLNALKIKKVAPHNFLNSLILKASTKL